MRLFFRTPKTAAIPAALILALVLSLTACGGSGQTTPSESASDPSAAKTSAEAAAAAASGENDGNQAAPASEGDALSDAAATSETAAADTTAAGAAAGMKSVAYEDDSAAAEGDEAAAGGGDKVFASEEMGFSFLYDAAHTAYITDTGAAQIAVNGDESLVGLFVSVVDDENMPEVSQILEESMFDETQKYQQAIVQPPAENEITVKGHTLEGYIFCYSDRQGETVDATYYVEVRDGKYIFYSTEIYRDDQDYWAGQNALEKAVLTLQLSADAYGESSAREGTIGSDNTPIPSEAPGDSAGENPSVEEMESAREEMEFSGGSGYPAVNYGSSAVFEGDYTFEIDDSKYLVLADEDLTMVYTGSGMEMPLFQVDDESDDIPFDSIGEYVVEAKNNTVSMLQNRLTGEPEVVTFSIGDRKFAGLEYSYSTVEGDRTIEAREYCMPVDGRVFVWYGLWNRGDETTPALMRRAMETFSMK